MKLFRSFNIISWGKEYLLLVLTVFLLIIIPLYPKLPLIGVQHTWVYIRMEDFLVGVAILLWGVQYIRKKATYKTPLTYPILFFWASGALSTILGVIYIFPSLANVFPKIAFLFWLRHVEYISLFFIAFSSLREKKHIKVLPIVLLLTLFGVVFYGMGQRYIGFPAYLTMNEEFAKGIPLRLSALARIPSTFAGHYDLAAYLVMIIPIMGSMVIGYKNKILKLLFMIGCLLGLVLLLMTASRTSFLMYLMAITFMLILQKKKWFILPVIILSILLLQSFQGISNRFGSTITQADVVVDARTGKTIGIAKKDTTPNDGKEKQIVIESEQSTGENLPQGSGFINIPQKQQSSTNQIIIKKSEIRAGSESAEITHIQGDFAVKKVLAYDVSFTTRFQGEWPRAIEAFKRNIFFGSGYSSISLATDGNYLRILGEVGLLGFVSFFLIFLVTGLYVYKYLPDVESRVVKSYILGVMAGIFGVALNAVLIDVFEASKVAFMLWLLIGSVLGALSLYAKKEFNVFLEVKKALLSLPALISYLGIITFIVYWPIIGNFFVGDDFTWLRWAGDCKKILNADGVRNCESPRNILASYFTNSEGFFYRPGTKVYFFIMYSLFWINATAYHLVSLILHACSTALIFLLSLRLFKKKLLAFITALFFLLLSINYEAIFWISSTGNMITSFLIFLSLYLFIVWRENKKRIFFVISLTSSFLAVFFYEMAIVTPALILITDIFIFRKKLSSIHKTWYYYIYAAIGPLYYILKVVSHSIWGTKDYSYNLLRLPFNVMGNLWGYFMLSVLGEKTITLYSNFRTGAKGSIVPLTAVFLMVLGGIYYSRNYIKHIIKRSNLSVPMYGFSFFFISLLTFLGLGNIAPRYVYLASFGIVIIMVFVIEILYVKISRNNKIIGTCFLLGVIVLYSVYHISEINRINKDWKKAGSITSNLLTGFNNLFFGSTPTESSNLVFYFVDIPIREKTAWVFPVGLSDALWFTFQDQNLSVHSVPTVEMAFEQAKASSSAHIFQFDKNGNVQELTRTEVPLPSAEKRKK